MTKYKECDILSEEWDLPEDSLVLDPSSINFDDIEVWTTDKQIITVRNTGKNNIYFKEIKVFDQENIDCFAYDDSSIPNGLKPGSSTKLEVSFTPKVPGRALGKIVITTLQGKEFTTTFIGTGLGIEKDNDDSGSDTPDEPIFQDLYYWNEIGNIDYAAFTPKSTEFNVSTYIIPKGTGSFALNSNASSRGQNTVDLQIANIRNDTAALGDYSSITGGRNNIVSGMYGYIGTGYINNTSGNSSFLGTGESNTISGDNSVLVSGSRNTSIGNKTALLVSESADINGEFNVVLNGISPIIGGDCNVIGFISNSNLQGEYNVILSTTNTSYTGNHCLFGISFESTFTPKEDSVILNASTTTLHDGTNNFIGVDEEGIYDNSSYIAVGTASGININSSVCNFIGSSKECIVTNTEFSGILSGNKNSIGTSKYSGILTAKSSYITTGNFNSILSGDTNTIADSKYSVIGSGNNNSISNMDYSIIITGANNSISGSEKKSSCDIINGSDNIITDSNNSSIYNSNDNSIATSRVASIINSYGSAITDSKSSSILSGRKHTITDGYNSVIVGGAYNQVFHNESVSLGGHRNVLEGTGNVALGGNYGTDFGLSHHVFHASKEGTNWIKKQVDDTTGLATEADPTDERFTWVNNNPIYQTGSILMQVMQDPTGGFYEGTSDYKRRLYTHSDKYVNNNIWGDLPNNNIFNTIVIPLGSVLYYTLKINLFDFVKNQGVTLLCEDGIISHVGEQLTVVKKHNLHIINKEILPIVEPVTETSYDIFDIQIILGDNTGLVTFELPITLKDYLGGAELQYSFLTNINVDFYWN